MYFKVANDGYILGLGIGSKGIEISENEYNSLTGLFHSKPLDTETVGYKLNELTLEWESYEKSAEPDVIDDSEAIDILLGGAS